MRVIFKTTQINAPDRWFSFKCPLSFFCGELSPINLIKNISRREQRVYYYYVNETCLFSGHMERELKGGGREARKIENLVRPQQL